MDLKNVPAIIANRAVRRQPLQIGYLRRRLAAQKTVPLPLSPSDPSKNDFPRDQSLDIPFEETLPASHFVTNRTSWQHSRSIGSREYYPWVNRSPDRYRASPIASSNCASYYENSGDTIRNGKCTHPVDTNTGGTSQLPESESEGKVQSLCPNNDLDSDCNTKLHSNSKTVSETKSGAISASNDQLQQFPSFSSWRKQRDELETGSITHDQSLCGDVTVGST